MPDLLDRMLGYLDDTESDLAVSPEVIVAAMFEFNRNELNETQIKAGLGLTQADWNGLATVYAAIFGGTPKLTIEEFRNLTTMGGVRNRSRGPSRGNPYYTKSKVMARLGL